MGGDWHPEWDSCGPPDPCAAQGIGAIPWDGRTLLAIAPQPSVGSVRVIYALRAPGSVRLEVLDAAGRVIRRLVDGGRAAGIAFVDWDGRDDVGRRAAPGAYFCRLSAGGEVKTERLVRVE